MAKIQQHGSDRAADEARSKQTTAVDTTQRVYLGEEHYHATLGCVRGVCEAATIAAAIKHNLRPCSRCQPSDYRVNAEPADNDANADEHGDHAQNHGTWQHVRADDITVTLPSSKPTDVAEIDPIVHTKCETRATAHIAARDGDHPAPLCVVAGTYNGTDNWLSTSQDAYPAPGEWFDLCTRCLVAYDRVTHHLEGNDVFAL